MPKPTAWDAINNFTTIFGTALNGSEVTWFNDSSAASDNTDRTELKIYWIQNLYSSLYTFYDSTDADDMNYFKGHADITGQSGAFTPTDDETAGTVQTEYYTGSILFHMQFQNPVTTATPQYDGFWTLAYPTVTAPVATDTAIKYSHDDPATNTGNTGGNRMTKPFDLMPASDYDLTLDTTDTTTPCQGGGETDSQWDWDSSNQDGTTGICLTQWRIGEKGVACVQVEGSFKRLMDQTDTNEAACDFSIDYSDHAVKIQMGQVGESDPTPYKFEATVSFGQFPTLAAGTTTSFAVSGLIPSFVVGLATLLTMSGF